MSIVYDQAPEIAYDPIAPRGPLPGSAGKNAGGDAPSEGGRAAYVDWAQPHREASSAAPTPVQRQSGFGGVVARRMLETGPPAKHPWLTVELAQQELAIGEYQADRAAVALDSAE